MRNAPPEAEQLAHNVLTAVRAIDNPCAVREVRDVLEEARDRLSDCIARVQAIIDRETNRDLFQ